MNVQPGQGTRKIVIDPVTRVEGHGKVTIRLNEAGEVEEARFHIVEFRGFERFIRGRMYWEVPVIVQRLCGICPVSHHLAAAKAMDQVVGVDRLTPTAEKMRRLMHYGQVLQSHALHIFHLASPDLLFGFDAPPGKRNIIAVLNEFPEIGKWAIFIRKFGQEVIKATGGRRIHPTSAVPGGISHNLSIGDRDRLRGEVDEITGWCLAARARHRDFAAANRALHRDFAAMRSNFVSLLGRAGEMDLYDGTLRAFDAGGGMIFDNVAPADYRAHFIEEVRSWSYLKFPHIRSRGREDGWYRVGPLAQINCCDRIGTPLAEAARVEFMAENGGGPVQSTLAYHWARLVCLVHCAEKIRELLLDDDLQGTDLILSGARRGEGVACIEAPRGTLIHHYTVDANDQVTSANLIVSTTNNNEAMNRAVKAVAMSATLHPPEQQTGATPRTLVIGYGNPGREDDGLGPAAAQAIARLDLPGVSTLHNYQLVLEDAVEIAAHDAVWFVDASRDRDAPCAIHRLEPAFQISFTTHLMKPQTLLAITAQQFGRRPTRIS